TVGRSVKGINLLNCIYHSNEASLLATFKLITKPIQCSDLWLGKKNGYAHYFTSTNV
ncbi:MAG: hypothetical protein ACI93H_001378, partial [Psychromonas sp.]